MQRGVINKFFPNKGYGFIDAEDGQVYFCHISNIDVAAGAYPSLGQEVSFEVKPRYKGIEAVDIKLV